MKNINDFLDMKENITEIKKNSLDELCKDPMIASFMKNNHLTRSDMDDYWLELINYKQDYPICLNCHCKVVGECPKNLEGFKRQLDYHNGLVTNVIVPCEKKEKDAKRNEILRRIHTNLPQNLFDGSLLEILKYNSKQASLYKLCNFLTDYIDNFINQKSIYLYGATQTGKTRSLAIFAYQYVSNNPGKSVGMYNVPNLMNQLKSSFNDDEISSAEIIDSIKHVDVLILDDIGGENFSTWSRDEVIGNIIEERCLSELPTFFSSVYSLDDLTEYYTTKQKGDNIKVSKLIGKIRSTCMEMDLKANKS